MEKDRGTRTLAVVALLIAVVGMTIGFAAFSTTLRIEGTGQVKGSKFSIIFADLGDAVTVGTAKEVTGGKPSIQTGNTLISNYQVELMTPGDSISYTFKIKNVGTYDAKISAITMAGREGGPEFTFTGGSNTDQTNVASHLSYTLKYANGDDVDVDDVLPKDGVETVTLTLTYEEFNDETELPEQTVTITNLGINIEYTQVED